MSDSTPICRCRVLWLGSAVPQASKDGLQGVQEPLRELYPEQGAAGAKGLDSWLSVWSNGILLENVDENHKKITRFFPIESLHYCAAVRYVLVPEKNTLHSPQPRFLPLDSPFARAPNPLHPPLFAAILRRTSGIKVLECHAFICKREMAANALVRCCFHAYADSSYAKHMETNGSTVASSTTGALTNGNGHQSTNGTSSLYGTLTSRKSTNSLPKMDHDEWQQHASNTSKLSTWKSQSMAGSTMTINSVGKADDMSIYNGDENHKVWAGSQDNLDGVYDLYSTSTMTRPTRPRQIAQPIEIPPPPKDTTKSKKKPTKKEDASFSLLNGKSKSEMHLNRVPKASSIAGGTVLKPRPMSTATLMRPVYGPGPGHVPMNGPMPHPHHLPPQPMYVMHPSTTLPKFFKHGGSNTFSHRNKKMMMASRPVPPPFVPVAPIIIPNTMQKGHKKKSKSQHHLHVDEPIYIPTSNRGVAPANGMWNQAYPPEAFMRQQFALEQQNGGAKYGAIVKKKMSTGSEKMMNGGMGKSTKKMAHSVGNGLDTVGVNGDVNGVDEEEDDDTSPFNTGIYRKKGHLNERAFSYSIRQEHRSRSYGSLANLKFAEPEDRDELKKEREIMQMVRDLDLSNDELERIEVPKGMYEPSTMMTSTPTSNGNGSLYRPKSNQHLATIMTNGRSHRR